MFQKTAVVALAVRSVWCYSDNAVFRERSSAGGVILENLEKYIGFQNLDIKEEKDLEFEFKGISLDKEDDCEEGETTAGISKKKKKTHILILLLTNQFCF